MSTEIKLSKEIRAISANIHNIKLIGIIDLVVHQGNEPKMEVFANDPGDLRKVLTTISGDSLIVSNEPMTIVTGVMGAKIVKYRNTDIIVNGSININGSFTINGSHINADHIAVTGQRSAPVALRVEVTLPNVSSLHVSGSGHAAYRSVDLDALSLAVSGAGSIESTGKVNRLEVDASGSGSVAAYSLLAKHGRLQASGMGAIKATITDTLVSQVSGVGKIKIKGNPTHRETTVSGVGKIKFKDNPHHSETDSDFDHPTFY